MEQNQVPSKQGMPSLSAWHEDITDLLRTHMYSESGGVANHVGR